MAEGAVIFREEHLLRLAPFCGALARAFMLSGFAPEQTAEFWRATLTAQCTRCGCAVFGDELFALTRPADAEAAPKTRRLSLGDCGRPGCESYFYRLTFRPHPGLDWPALIAQAGRIQAAEARPPSPTGRSLEMAKRFWRYSATRRTAIGIVLVLLLLLIRQWSAGGRIPWVREPEHFQVTVGPGEHEDDGR